MSDVLITPASVVPGADALTFDGTLGATVTAGQVLYEDSLDSNALKLADADGSTNAVKGIALNSGAIGQACEVHRRGPLTIGGTLVKGTPYFLSDSAGGICPWEDLGSGCKVILLGIATSTSVLDVLIYDPDVTL